MYKSLQYIIDFLFPPKPEELLLRSKTVDWFLNNSPKASPTENSFIDALFFYKDPLVREMIWQIKYKKNMHAIKIAGYSLYEELIKTNEGKLTLIPIPISKSRRKERGYNQCELIIDEIIKFDKKSQFSKDYTLLIREKDIEKQTLKNRKERIINTKHIFKVTNTINVNQNIIIIDDVTTTGSTIIEARNELLLSGYKNIKALTIAH